LLPPFPYHCPSLFLILPSMLDFPLSTRLPTCPPPSPPPPSPPPPSIPPFPPSIIVYRCNGNTKIHRSLSRPVTKHARGRATLPNDQTLWNEPVFALALPCPIVLLSRPPTCLSSRPGCQVRSRHAFRAHGQIRQLLHELRRPHVSELLPTKLSRAGRHHERHNTPETETVRRGDISKETTTHEPGHRQRQRQQQQQQQPLA
jgi:hypothetical protein